MVPLLRHPWLKKSEKAADVASATGKWERNPGGDQSLQSLPKLSCGIDALETAAGNAVRTSLKQSACLDGQGRGERDASIVGV
jgi:hypothetical protein